MSRSIAIVLELTDGSGKSHGDETASSLIRDRVMPIASVERCDNFRSPSFNLDSLSFLLSVQFPCP
jgi:hypothetical protein